MYYKVPQTKHKNVEKQHTTITQIQALVFHALNMDGLNMFSGDKHPPNKHGQ